MVVVSTCGWDMDDAWVVARRQSWRKMLPSYALNDNKRSYASRRCLDGGKMNIFIAILSPHDAILPINGD